MLKLGKKIIGKGTSRTYARSPQRLAHDQQQAEQWVRQGLRIAGLKEKDLPDLKGNDERKVVLARLVWEKTTVSQGWIARRLRMGGAANVCQLLRRAREKKNPKKLPPALSEFIQSQSANE